MAILATHTPSPVAAEEVWDPSKSVSYSSMTLHRQCPQAWQYRYVRGLESTRVGVARDLGSWWHLVRAMDSLDRGEALGSLRDVPDRLRAGDDYPVQFVYLQGSGVSHPRYSTTDERITDAPPSADLALTLAGMYWATLTGTEREMWEDAIGEPLPDRLDYMNARWLERWSAALRDEAPIGVEVRFSRDLPGTDGARLPGTVDEVYLDTRRNLLVVRDHKTGGSLPSQESSDDLADSQLHLYAWGLIPVVSSWSMGKVAALSYDRARSAKPKTPVLTLAGALSKGVSDYDLHTYRTWAAGVDGQGVPFGEEGVYFKTGKRAGEPKFGHYVEDPKVVERLSSPQAESIWFQRTLTPVNHNVIRAHLLATLNTQRQTERTLAYVAQHGEAPRSFHRRLCGYCDFRHLCRAEMLGGPDGAYPLEDFDLKERTRK